MHQYTYQMIENAKDAHRTCLRIRSKLETLKFEVKKLQLRHPPTET